MRNPKFTKGPWRRHNGIAAAYVSGAPVDGHTNIVCQEPTALWSKTSWPHNARAISAVPDMYTLLAELEGVDTLAPVFTDRIKSLLDKIDNI